ncbi:hypothetical protein CC2G_011315 [Coprinopsis cinerea AmutBmut pab1-1]|nr:hypothetical protein CC2G_011315 [Coprinopsis cinerea AmutBmut pab1-1]
MILSAEKPPDSLFRLTDFTPTSPAPVFPCLALILASRRCLLGIFDDSNLPAELHFSLSKFRLKPSTSRQPNPSKPTSPIHPSKPTPCRNKSNRIHFTSPFIGSLKSIPSPDHTAPSVKDDSRQHRRLLEG